MAEFDIALFPVVAAAAPEEVEDVELELLALEPDPTLKVLVIDPVSIARLEEAVPEIKVASEFTTVVGVFEDGASLLVADDVPAGAVVEGAVVVSAATVVDAVVEAGEPVLAATKKLGEYESVPVYPGQPGTLFLLGALPPPQS